MATSKIGILIVEDESIVAKDIQQSLKKLGYEVLEGKRPTSELIRFVRDINNTEYGTREFAIRDPNGYVLYFIQLPPASA